MSGTLLSDSIKKATDSLSLRSSRGFNFTLASLDNERFVTAFLRNISLDTVHVFSSSGDFHRQLLFTLVADSISLNPGGANQKVVQNGTATRERFEQFQSALADLVASGLSTERFIRSDSIGIELTREELLTDRRFFGTELANDRNIQVLKVSTPAGERYRVVRFTPSVRFCLSPQEYAQRSGLKLAPSLDCRPSHLRTGVSALAADAQANDSLAIELRSAREVYRFVGRLAMAQVRQTDWVPSIHLPERQAGIVAGSHPLIVLRKGSPAPGEKVLAIAEHMGATYYVPFENSGFSARVFECLSLLLSSSMVKDAIPTQPAILIR
jgi:hypothetical protein